MIDALSGIAGAIGLSGSAGLNAYLPLLVAGLAARYTTLIRLNEPWNVLASGWVIGVLAMLLLIEMTVDKIPAVDTQTMATRQQAVRSPGPSSLLLVPALRVNSIRSWPVLPG